MITALLQAGADIGVQDDKFGWTPLHHAASNNINPEVITALLQAGAEVNARDKDKKTPLMLAVMYNSNPSTITTLLEAGADAKALDCEDKTALDYAERDASLRETDAYRQLQEASR